jgi:hypothetical protein
MEAIKISLDDYVLSGGGANGESYDHKDIEEEIRPFSGLKTLIVERDTQCPMPQFRAALSRVLQ